MKRKKKKLAVLLAGALVLAALLFVLILVRRKSAEYEAKESQKVLIIDVTADKIKAIRYTPAGGKEVAFERQMGLWVSTSDPDAHLDQTKVSTLASSVTGIAVTQTIENVTDLEQYGLVAAGTEPVAADRDESATTLSVTDMDGNTTTLVLGDTNEMTMDVYCCKNGDLSTVYAVSSGITVCLDQTIEDYLAADEEDSTAENVAADEEDSTAEDLAVDEEDSTVESAAVENMEVDS